MADYQFLTDQDKADIVASLKVERPDPKKLLLEQEKNHYRATVLAKAGLGDDPDPYQPPDTSKEDAVQVALEAEATKLPAPTPKADVGVSPNVEVTP